jgi:hypothetical protein
MPRISPITGKVIEDKPKVRVTMEAPAPTVEAQVAEVVTHEVKKDEPIEDSETEKWTSLHIDSQELSMFMSCPYKYNLVFNRHLQAADGNNKSIDRGSIVHAGLLDYWKEMIASGDYQEATKKCITKAKLMIEKDVRFNMEEKLFILQTILDFLKHIQGNSWIPLEAEKYFRVKAYEDAKLRMRIYLTGRIDLLIKTPQIPLLPIDFKTEAERWFYSQMSNQFRIYAIVCGVNLVGVQRIGFQTSLEVKDKFKLELLPFDQDILDEYREEQIPYWGKQMLLAHEDNCYPMNNTACVKGHFKCEFSDGASNKGICNVSRTIREQKIARYFVVGEEWDPSKVE